MTRGKRVLIVDDEKPHLDLLEAILGGEGYLVKTAGSAEEALYLLERTSVDLVLTDLIMTGMDGIELLKKIKEQDKEIAVIIITGYGSIENAVEAMKIGAASYFIKGQDPEALLLDIDRTLETQRLRRDNQILREERDDRGEHLLKTVTTTFQEVIRTAERAAGSKVNILITGESGVGKEVLAKHIHTQSDRAQALFLAVNCHALPEHLLESELFGHEKGSFTGADRRRTGKFEAAHGGTMFLDEIGDISPSFQAKLLRVIETKTLERIGSNRSLELDFRMICATNCDLSAKVARGEFREDLFYRLNTITLEIPPLRERRGDLPELMDFFFDKIGREQKKTIKRIERGVFDYLNNHTYPGNVRELRNLIERLVALSDDGLIRTRDLPTGRRRAGNEETPTLREMRKRAESDHIREVLATEQGNITRAARILGISRRQLFNKIREYGLQAGPERY